MTEKIQKAIDKIDQEAEKMGSATVRLLCSHIIDHCLVNDENADKVLAEGKSLKGCWDSHHQQRTETSSGQLRSGTGRHRIRMGSGLLRLYHRRDQG